MTLERLQKILARAGHGSRRACESIIAAGRVRVNGELTDAPGTKADPETDAITVDGRPICTPKPVYIIFNKPAGCICAASDDRGRATVMDFLGDAPERVFHVGRLDFDTEGLLLFTNDGEFSQRVTHPGHKVYKTYDALIEGTIREETLDKLRAGITLDDGPTAPALVSRADKPAERIITRAKGKRRRGKNESVVATWINIRIREGRKRQVRRMFLTVGHRVVRLRRTRIGQLFMGDLPVEKWRLLTSEEAALALEGEPSGDSKGGSNG